MRITVLLACGFAPPVFAVVLLVAGVLRPGYDSNSHFGSELSLGPWGWVQVANFVVTGVLTMVFAIGLRRVLTPGRGAVAAPLLTFGYGLTLVVAGVFSTDPKHGYPPGATVPAEPTVEGLVHDLNALPNFAALAATTFVMAARFAGEPGNRAWMWYSLGTGLVVVATFVVSSALYMAAVRSGDLANAQHGTWQRICIIAGFGWFGALAAVTLRATRRTSG